VISHYLKAAKKDGKKDFLEVAGEGPGELAMVQPVDRAKRGGVELGESGAHEERTPLFREKPVRSPVGKPSIIRRNV